MDTRTDNDLTAAYAQARDEDAFMELVARHQRMVYRVWRMAAEARWRVAGHEKVGDSPREWGWTRSRLGGSTGTRRWSISIFLRGFQRRVGVYLWRKNCFG